MSEIKRRILEYLKINGISKASFYEASGIAASNFKGAGAVSELGGDKIVKILTLYKDLNANWLLTGRGNIFNTKTPENTMLSEHGEKHGEKHGIPKLPKTPCNLEYPKGEESFERNIADVVVDKVFKLRTDRLVERQQIPIYDMKAVAGLVPLFANQYSQSIIEVMETTLIPKCDGGLRIVGDSMYPLLKSGDIVFYKQIHDIINNIVWGEMYLVSFDVDGDEYVSVKYLQRSELPDHITLVSYNEHHKPMDIHISRIRALAFIKASLRLNSIK